MTVIASPSRPLDVTFERNSRHREEGGGGLPTKRSRGWGLLGFGSEWELGGLYRLGFQQLWPAGFWYMVSDCERGSESDLTFLVRSLRATFPFNSVCRSDHSGWNPLTINRGVHP